MQLSLTEELCCTRDIRLPVFNLLVQYITEYKEKISDQSNLTYTVIQTLLKTQPCKQGYLWDNNWPVIKNVNQHICPLIQENHSTYCNTSQ